MKKVIIVIISLIVLTSCKEVNTIKEEDLYKEYIDLLDSTSIESKCSELKVEFIIDKLDNNYLNYIVLINRNNTYMKDVTSIVIHDKTSINSFPSIGIYDSKISLTKESDKDGVKLSGYLEYVDDINFKLYISYIDIDNNSKECIYFYNYRH